MKRIKLILLALLLPATAILAQTKTDVKPTFSPTSFKYNQPVTVTYDVTGTPLANLTTAYIWVWTPNNTAIGAPYDFDPASSNTTATDHAKCVKNATGGKTTFSITFNPSSFFTGDISHETQMGILLKGNAFTDGQTTDDIITFQTLAFQVFLTAPTTKPLFAANGQSISVAATSTQAATFNLLVNGTVVNTQTNVSNYTYALTASNSAPSSIVKLVGTAGANKDSATFTYIVSNPSPAVVRPSGIKAGINYGSDDSKVTLCLWAPQKTSVYVRGDFTNWDILSSNLMNRDGEFFWLEVDGLTSGKEYSFQYLVDQAIWVADPYAEKILDPDDQYIPASSYPGLQAYPSKALNQQSYFNRLSVFQTGQVPFAWQANSYVRPPKEKLVIYELIVRDFIDASHRNYQTIIDTLSYFKRLGITAIELMPIAEFNGNDSWGYNPTFMFAPDKAYGTKNDLKAFVDACHQQGIAVIMDIVMNQQDLPNTYVAMYFDYVNNKPLPSNPWFNVTATHPYSVFYDMNHESPYTKKYLDTVNYHWLHDYHMDGLRFDLSKGFTQTNNPNNVDAWGQYDASRIAILERMSDVIWSYAPDTYVILEHFAANQEEKELAEYRSNENLGMMLWENYNYAYNQNTMGYASGSDFSTIYYANKGWTVPHAVGYMESHDEERLMYNNLQNGNVSGTYNVKTLSTALARMKAAAALFYTVPGPKMLYEFGDLGYDQGINRCTDGTYNTGCRVSDKPVLWNYQQQPDRQALYQHIADLNRMRQWYPLFAYGNATFVNPTGLTKQLTLKNKSYTATPADSTQMNAQVAANFDVTTQSVSVNFSHAGTWYDYYAGGTAVTVTGSTMTISLAPGQYKLYTDVHIKSPKLQAITFGAITTKALTDAPFTLNATASSGLPVAFSSSDTTIASVSGNKVTVHKGGLVAITALQPGNTTYLASSATQSFCVTPATPVVTVTTGSSGLSTLRSSSTTGNQWYVNGTVINGANSVTYTPAQSGVYTVQVTISSCPSNVSADVSLIVTGIENQPSLTVYPNPVTDRLIISADSGDTHEVCVYSMTGQKMTTVSGPGELQISTKEYPAGVYIAKISGGGAMKVVRFVKQ